MVRKQIGVLVNDLLRKNNKNLKHRKRVMQYIGKCRSNGLKIYHDNGNGLQGVFYDANDEEKVINHLTLFIKELSDVVEKISDKELNESEKVIPEYEKKDSKRTKKEPLKNKSKYDFSKSKDISDYLKDTYKITISPADIEKLGMFEKKQEVDEMHRAGLFTITETFIPPEYKENVITVATNGNSITGVPEFYYRIMKERYRKTGEENYF